MDQIPERRLTPEARARRRTDLMAAIAADDSGGARHRRWLVPVAAAAAVAVVGGAAYLATTAGGDPAGSPAPIGGNSGSAEPPTTSAPPEEPCDAPSASLPPEGQGVRDAHRMRLHPELRTYRDIVARHLDPDGQHLDRRVTNQQSTTARCDMPALGTKLGWSVAGEDGLGVVEVEVGRHWRDSQIRMHREAFGGKWRTVPLDLPGVEVARVVEYDDGVAVAVTRSDGLTVALDANNLFGNNSLTPISGFGFTTEDLLETAADPEFTLP